MYAMENSWTAFGFTAIAIIATVLICRRKQKPKPPKLWKATATVSNLFIYPLRDSSSMELNSALCTNQGLVEFEHQLLDRSFLIYYSKNNELKPAIKQSKTATISISTYNESQVQLNAPDMPTLHVDIPTDTAHIAGGVRFVSNRQIYTLDCGDEAADWVSKYVLNKNCGLRLGFIDKNVSISDILVINRASIDDFNANLSRQRVTPIHFKPNILLESIDCPPFADDTWKWIKIGNVILRNMEPRGRSVRINNDRNTDIRSEKMQALKTYRDLDLDGPVMGYRYEVYCPGVVAKNDTVYVA